MPSADNIATSLVNLRDELSQESCVPKDPFIKLGTGTAPTINYNIPQTSSFSTYGNFKVKGVKTEDFQGYAKTAPVNNFFDRVTKFDLPTLQQKFSEAVQLQSQHSVLLPNNHLLRKNLDVAKSNLDMVALGAHNDIDDSLKASVTEKSNAINEVQLARLAKEGQQPYVVQKIGGFQTRLNFLQRPIAPSPYFVVIEEYKTTAYLGDYGAGRTIKTFSLLPGEKTTMTVRTYKDTTSMQSSSENVLDSFSEDSTSDLENNIEAENSVDSSSTTNISNTDSSSHNWNVNASASASLFGIIKIGGGGGGGGSTSSTDSVGISGTRASNVKTVNRALDKHVANSNSNRQINVNTSTTDTATTGEEETTVRELTNYNKSRVLNFVFRQLLQEYVVITSLSNIRIAYCNGYSDSLRVVDLEGLEDLLADTILPGSIESVRRQILKPYCSITNYQDDEIPFIERKDLDYGTCLGGDAATETYWRIAKGLNDSYTTGGLTISVPGVILDVKTQTLRTSSMVVDALLGQGNALDCYNQKIQDAQALDGYLNNMQQLQQIEAVELFDDPQQRADAYKKVFGSCCETAQTQIVH